MFQCPIFKRQLHKMLSERFLEKQNCLGMGCMPCSYDRVFGFFPCLLTLAIVACGYFIAIFQTFIPLLSPSPVLAVVGLVVTHILVGNILLNFFLSIFCDPGTVPSSWSPRENMKTLRGSWSRSIQLVPDEENAQDGTTSSLRPVVTWEFKRNGEPRFCRICGVYKPDRTHHCRSCKRCILKMDHHCPWINNCVGFYNQKFFILFLYCAVLGCLFVMGTGMTALKQALVHINQDEGQEVVRSAIVIICYCIVFIFGIALLFFAGFHTILVLKGRTTIELHEIRDPARSRVVRKYDLGWKKNWQKVFGTCWFYWFLPVRWSIGGDGLTFESVTNEQVGLMDEEMMEH